MKFKTYVEAFDKPYKWKKKFEDDDRMAFIANLDDGRELEVQIRFDNGFADAGILFYVDKKISLTGKGDAFRIFATVKEIIEKNINYLKGFDAVSFSAKSTEHSRVKLYKVFSKWLKKKLKSDLSIEDDGSYTVYRFTKENND